MLRLIRSRFTKDGIFGELQEEDGKHVCDTLEHSYENKPKLPDGNYTCILGKHRLASMTHTFDTYEIKGVPGHTGILFHSGNTNEDSNGCVLVGILGHNEDCVYRSRATFAILMSLLKNTPTFQLEVTSKI